MAVSQNVCCFIALLCYSAVALPNPSSYQEDPAVTNLRTYLKTRTHHPDPEAGYEKAFDWLKEQAEDIGLDFHSESFGGASYFHEFALWMTWNGTNPGLQSVLLNSHMDVVAADPDKWLYDPYGAHKDANGNIYARGVSDMKSATVAELEAIRRLKNSGFQPLRTIHLVVSPDEEVGGGKGIVPFLKTEAFKNLNVGVDIDEGFPRDSSSVIDVNYAEKNSWSFIITAYGEASHASYLPQYTAGQRLQVVIDKLMEFRESEYKKLENESIEFITTINMGRVGGGIGDNVIPNELWASFNMRIWTKPGWNYTDVENMLMDVIEEARLGSEPNDVNITFRAKSMEAGRTVIDDSNIWWTKLQNSCRQMNVTCDPHVFNAATDGRFVRDVGIPVFGFCPFPDTPNTAHEDNESINEVNFLRGIDRYITVIRNFASVPANVHP